MNAANGNQLEPIASCLAYPFKRYRKVAYINSTGICNLKCDYCFTNNNKAPMSLSNAEIDFLFESFGDNFLLCFSGQGDFFAGYRKQERFLEHILQYNVKLYLDFNGVTVRELLELEGSQLDKILHFDVSFHYESMVQQGVLAQWVNNISGLAEMVPPSRWHVKAIVCMCHLESLHEKVAYYAASVFPRTGKKLQLVLDDFDNTVFSPPVVKLVNAVMARFPEAVEQHRIEPKTHDAPTKNQEFCRPVSSELLCPAGSLYFKINLNGDVLPCNKIGAERHLILGNLKRRELGFLPRLIPCACLAGPGCLVNWDRQYPPA